MATPSIVQLFLVLLISGLILFGAEIFVPGGVLGFIGSLALLGAITAGFKAFGPANGALVAIGIVLLVGAAVYLWIKVFPRTTMGRKMIVSRDLAEAKSADPGNTQFLGREGTAATDLRPGGFALIDGRRVDVITQGGMVAKGTSIRVVEVEGSRVIVAQV